MKKLGMLFGTGLFAVSMAVAAPQDTTNQQDTTGQDQSQQQQTTQPDQSQQKTTTTTKTQQQLPRTAGEAPLAGLLGLMALGGAAGFRILRKRTA